MAFNPFIGMVQTDLETALQSAQADLLAGKSTIAAQSGSVGIKSQIAISPQRRVELILRALNLLAPLQYPIDQVVITDNVRIAFSPAGAPPDVDTILKAPVNSIDYAGPPVLNPPQIPAIVVDINGRQWQFFQGAWH